MNKTAGDLRAVPSTRAIFSWTGVLLPFMYGGVNDFFHDVL